MNIENYLKPLSSPKNPNRFGLEHWPWSRSGLGVFLLRFQNSARFIAALRLFNALQHPPLCRRRQQDDGDDAADDHGGVG